MNTLPQIGKFRLSRRGKKLQSSDDQRTLIALPRDVPERTWAEILQKEENDLLIFDIREDILDETFKICFEKYMAKQSTLFTVFCAAEAWLKLINWYFFRHDPGEDPSAYPPCSIPARAASWAPDERPEPSPRDSWCRQPLPVLDPCPEDGLRKWPSSSSVDMPVVESIPEEYWFPGKVQLPIEYSTESSEEIANTTSYEQSVSDNVCAESEVLQNITDYSTSEDVSAKESSISGVKNTTPELGSLQGAGDAAGPGRLRARQRSEKSKLFTSKPSVGGRSKGFLPPLDGDSRSRISIISDCRLRGLRLDTQYEITSEKIDTPPGEPGKRK